jgi:hypothetical protein
VVLLPNEMRRAQRQEDAKRRYGLYTEIMDTNTSNEKLFHKLIRDRPFNFSNFLKKYSDFGGGKKKNLFQSFCHIT